MEKVRKVVKKYYLRQIITYWLACWMFFGLPAQVAMATPAGGVVSTDAGGANISYNQGTYLHTTQVEVLTGQTIIDWTSLDTLGGAVADRETLAFLQQSGLSNSAVLNRISGATTQFNGDLTGAGMRIFMVNPAGIIFGDGATINVAQLVASGLGMTNQAFLDATDLTQNNKMAFAGGGGDVIVVGQLDATGTGSLYLVGHDVFNYGSILCPDGLVVMAAGDEVQLAQPGSSVIVTLADLLADVENNVHNNGTVGTSDDPVDKLVLAAGDVWSQAISNVRNVKIASVTTIDNSDLDTIDAYSDGNSDAVATIEIISGGDINLKNAITAHAYADTGDSADDAIATVKIDAGGNVNVTAHVRAQSDVESDSGSAVTRVDVDAGGDVVMTGGRFSAASWGGNETVDLNQAKVEIDATNVTLQNDSSITADAQNGLENTGDIIIKATQNVTVTDSEIYVELHDSDGTNTATVDITAGGNVEVTATSDEEAEIMAIADGYGQNNIANVKITADGNVKVQEDASFYDWSEAIIMAFAGDGENNTANVMVDAGGDVEVIANHGSAEIMAGAYDGDNNTSLVKVNAGDNVNVQANAVYTSNHSANAKIEAEAEDGFNNDADTVINAAADVIVTAIGSWKTDAKISAEAENDFDVEGKEVPEEVPGITNDAKVDMTARNVEVTAEDGAEANIQAQAGNEIELESNDYPVDVTVAGSLVNNAEVKIVTGTLEPDPVDGGVLVQSYSGGEAWIGAEAYNEIDVDYDDSYYDVDLTINGSLLNTAKVDITAADQVRVLANGFDSGAWIFAEAGNEIGNESDVTANLIVNGNLNNQADVLIDAGDDTDLDDTCTPKDDLGDDVEVYAEHGSEAMIGAIADNYLYDLHESGETLNVTVNGSVDNIANVNITTGDEVWVVAYGYSYDDDSEAGILAEARNEIEAYDWDDCDLYEGTVNLTVTGSVNNQADVVINAGDNVEVEGTENAEAYLEAWTGNEIEAGNVSVDISGSVNNAAAVDITSGDDIEVTANYGEAYLGAGAENYLEDRSDNTLDVTVGGSVRNTAVVDLHADEDVEIYSSGGYSDAEIEAWTGNSISAWNEDNQTGGTVTVTVAGSVTNQSDILVEAADADDPERGGEVDLDAYSGGRASMGAYAENWIQGGTVTVGIGDSVSNIANVDISSSDDVDLYASGYNYEVQEYSDAFIEAVAKNEIQDMTLTTVDVSVNGSIQNQAIVDIEANGDVEVRSYDADAGIFAEAYNADDNTAIVTIDAVGGDVIVEDDGYGDDSAEIVAKAEGATNSNTADVQINATATATTYDDDGEVYTKVNGGNVKVIARNGGHAEIRAFAAEAENREMDTTSNTANVTIRTNSAEGTMQGEMVKEPVLMDEYPYDILEPAVYEEVVYTEGGDVTVEVQNGGEAAIQAETMRADENNSDVLVCAEGEVVVSDENSQGPTAQIISVARNGSINNAYTGVRGAEGISVLADSGHALIAAEAMFGLDCGWPAELNTAFTSLCTDGDVLVIGQNYGTAEVLALANEGLVNNADVGVCADGDILVAAGIGTDGGTAKIRAEARAGQYDYKVPVGEGEDEYELVNTTSAANTTVVSHNGGIGVIDIGGPTTALIEAEAYYSGQNNAYVGVAAGADLAPEDLVEPVTNGLYHSPIDGLLGYIQPGNVNVESYGYDGHAYISAKAYDGFENTAETVVCAPGEVLVRAHDQGGQAVIDSRAEMSGNSATTRVYATDVYVVSEDGGAVIRASAYPDSKSVTDYSLTDDGEVVDEGEATLIIQDYEEAEDCPDCPPCPDCDLTEDEPIGPFPAPLGVSPLPGLQGMDFGQGGCPALMEWLANEVGVAVDVKVFVSNAFVSSTDCQPCETAARLKAAATVLTDEDGSAMAAMNQVFNELAPANAPFTPEMANSIVTAFAGRVNDGTQYAAAIEYIDAFVQYIAILNTEMGSPVADSVAYVMERYGSDVSDNANMAAFLASRLESGETFAQ